MTRLLFLLVFLGICPLAQAAQAANNNTSNDFHHWRDQFRAEALSQGISPLTFDTVFQNVEPNLRVIELDGKQPERAKIGFATYLKNVLSQKRIDDGRIAAHQNQDTLYAVSKQYGVSADVIVSLWGIETSYGKNTGGYDLITALATLAWEGRRAEFFKKELIEALMILQEGHIDRANFKGSWAGAMGQNQFMPSSWQRYAVDYNGDGHRDIWTSKADIFASSANYLHVNGWNPDLKWGWPIQYTDNLKVMNKIRKPYTEWLKDGVHFKKTPPSIAANTQLMLVIPDDGDGRAYLVSSNFDVIMSWNKSTYFALTVGLLSDFVGKTVRTEKATSAYNE